MRNHVAGFFGTLGHLAGRQQENQLSRTFQACFTESQGFRDAVFSTLRNVCGLKLPATKWECRTEQAHADGRLDIELLSEHPSIPTIILESKVGSVLTLGQLRRYRSQQRGKLTHVIAITKNRPEVPIKRLTRDGIYTLRWQDVYRALGAVTTRAPVDRFLATSFMEYLERADMAYPDHLTLDGLGRAGKAIRALHGQLRDGAPAKIAFQDLHTACGLLEELGTDLREEFTVLAKRARWGPAVVQWKYPNGRREVGIATSFWRDGGPKLRSFGWGFAFDVDQSRVRWYVDRWVGNDLLEKYLSLQPYFKSGVVDRDLMLKRLRHYVRKWVA